MKLRKLKLILVLMFILSITIVSSLNFQIEILEDNYDVGDNITIRVSGNNLTDMKIYRSSLTYDGLGVEFKRLNIIQNELSLDDSLTTGFSLIPGIPTWEVAAYCEGNCSEGVLAEFVFEVLNGNETEIKIITDEDMYCFMKSIWGDTNLTRHVFDRGSVKLFDDFRTITRNETENKTTIVFDDTNKMIEVYNVDVLEVEDKTNTTKKIELKLQGNGTETVELNLTSFGEPYFVYVDGVETEFSFTDNILAFTTNFSVRDITIDYNAPEPPVEDPVDSPSGSPGGSTCNTKWNCTEWSECGLEGLQKRICSITAGYCTPRETMPETSKYCINEQNETISLGNDTIEATETEKENSKIIWKTIFTVIFVVIIAIALFFALRKR